MFLQGARAWTWHWRGERNFSQPVFFLTRNCSVCELSSSRSGADNHFPQYAHYSANFVPGRWENARKLRFVYCALLAAVPIIIFCWLWLNAQFRRFVCAEREIYLSLQSVLSFVLCLCSVFSSAQFARRGSFSPNTHAEQKQTFTNSNRASESLILC